MAQLTRALYQRGIVALIVMTAACSSSETGEREANAPSEVGEMAAYASGGLPPLEERAASERIPASFALGRAATNEEIARQDIHIMPDGRGLPVGSGTAAAGAELYKVRCAACHGNAGEGTPLGAALIASDPEVGFNRRVVGHFWPHATTAFDYIRRAMPWDAPGTLTNSEVYSVVAFILAENGVISRDDVLDADALKAIRMPALDRFVVDDRLTTNQVR
jgi:mono/diheme cytochrome c family protein